MAWNLHEAAKELRRLNAVNADLLEALQELLEETKNGLKSCPLTRDKAKAAIAKALNNP